MKREELLAWIGVVLAIPPIIYMVWAEGKWSAAAFVMLVVIALVREYMAGKRRENMPLFTAILIKKRIVIDDVAARKATFEALYRLRANQRTGYFATAYLGGDGRIDNIKMDGAVPAEVLHKGNRIEMVKRFDRELIPGEEVDVTVTYDQIDSFPSKTEGFGHTVEFESHTISLEVVYHSQKPCLSGMLLRRYGGSLQNGGKYRRADDGSRLETDIVRPSTGAEYILQWKW
jgi:hypothetical protein